MPYELKTIKVVLRGEELIVSEASNLMDVNRSLLISDADANWPDGAKETKDQAQRYLETHVYPSLVACTSGNIPTLEEFINNIPATDSAAWIIAVRELNPRWFNFSDANTPEEKQAEEEKNA